MLEILLLAYPDLSLDDAQAALITSVNGVRGLTLATERRDLKLLAVGDATAAAARRAGFRDVLSAEGDVTALAALARRSLDPRGGPVVHVGGADIAGDLTGALRQAGFAARRAIVYRAEPALTLPEPARTALAAAPPALDAVLLHSPRGAETFETRLREAGLAAAATALDALCLSPAVAEAAAGLPWRAIRIAARPDEDALLTLLDPA